MWDFIGIIGFLGCLVFGILAFIASIKKNGTAKKKGLIAGICLIVMIIGVAASSNDTSSTTSKTTTASSTNTKEDPKLKYANLSKKDIPSLTDNKLELQDKTFNFISQNYKLFPAKTPEDIQQVKSITDSTIEAKHLNKDVTPYLDKMVTFSGTVIRIKQNTNSDNETETLVHVIDDEMQSYQVLLFKPANDIFEKDNVRFWGVPVGPSSFDNVSGGTTNVQFFVGADIEKQ